jgi:hypothetical protein
MNKGLLKDNIYKIITFLISLIIFDLNSNDANKILNLSFFGLFINLLLYLKYIYDVMVYDKLNEYIYKKSKKHYIDNKEYQKLFDDRNVGDLIIFNINLAPYAVISYEILIISFISYILGNLLANLFTYKLYRNLLIYCIISLLKDLLKLYKKYIIYNISIKKNFKNIIN